MEPRAATRARALITILLKTRYLVLLVLLFVGCGPGKHIQNLRSGGPEKRLAAITELAKLEEKPPAVVNALVGAVMDSDARVRKAAADALNQAGWKADSAAGRASHAIAMQDFPAALQEGKAALIPIENALSGESFEYQVTVTAEGKTGKEGIPGKAALAVALATLKKEAVELLIETVRSDDTLAAAGALLVLEVHSWKPESDADREAVAKVEAKKNRPVLAQAVWTVYASDKPSVRQLAARMWGITQHAEGLSEALRDTDHEVRQAAVMALADLDSKDSIELLSKAAKDKVSAVRVQAVAALSKSQDLKAAQALVEALKGEGTHEVAALALTKFKDPAVLPILAQAFECHRAEVRAMGAQLIGAIPGDESVRLLSVRLRDTDAGVRRAVLAGLQSQNWRPTSIVEQALVACITRNEDEILELGTPENAPAKSVMVHALKDRSFPSHIAAAALGGMGDKTAIDELLLALNDDRKLVREASALALAKLGSREAVAPIMDAARKDKIDLRPAVQALQVLKPVKALIAASGSTDPKLAKLAVTVLGALADESSIPALARAVNHTNPGVAREAIIGLGRSKNKKALPALLKLTADKQATTRRWAVWALGELNAPEAIPALCQALEDEEAFVRKMAVLAISRSKSTAAPSGLVTKLTSPMEDTRKLAANALRRLGWKPSTARDRALIAAANGQPFKAFAEGGAAVDALAALSQSRSSDTRGLAFQMLGLLGDRRAAAALLNGLKDKEPWVRQQATQALGAIQTPEVTNGLIQALRDPDYVVHMYVLEALGSADPKTAVPAITGVLRSLDVAPRYIPLDPSRKSMLRVTAFKSLGKLKAVDATKVLTITLANRSKGRQFERAAAAAALGEIGSLEAVQALVAVVLDSTETKMLRDKAADALRKCGDVTVLQFLLDKARASANPQLLRVIPATKWDHRAAPVLIIAIRTSKDPARSVFLEALTMIDDPKAEDTMLAALDEKAPHLKAASARSLGKMRSSKAVDRLIPLLKPKGWFGAKKHGVYGPAAAEALGSIGDPKAVQPLVAALDRKQLQVSATEALGLLKAKESLAKLRAQLQNSTPEVRSRTIVALARIAGKEISAELYPLLNDSHPGVREAVCRALGELKDANATGPLTNALNDSEKPVRQAAATALGRLKAKDAFPSLATLVKRDQSAVAVSAIAALGTERSTDFLLMALIDRHPDVRRAAIKELGKRKEKRAIRPLIKAMKNHDALLIIQALGNYDTPEVRQALLDRLKQDFRRVEMRKALSEALQRGRGE